MRQTIKEIEVNIAYRWFLDMVLMKKYLILPLLEKIIKEDFRIQKYFEEIFNEIISEAIKCRFVNIESVFIMELILKLALIKS